VNNPGPPPLQPFGLVLHRDGRWSHEGHPITNRRLREAFDRAVRYLPEEEKYVVQLGPFRGEIELEEAGFFVRSADPAIGSIALSDGSTELLDPASLHRSGLDDAWLCRVKRELAPGGLAARFTQSAWAQLLEALEETEDGPALRLAGRLAMVPTQ
jgi:hypothetical protein